jgi:HprK-related kinase A
VTGDRHPAHISGTDAGRRYGARAAALSQAAPRRRQLFRLGPFTVQLTTPIRSLSRLLEWFYGDAALPPEDAIVQFDLRVEHGAWYRRLLAPQATFTADGQTPFAPFPQSHALPLFEWGLNWSIAMRAHQFLMLHAGVVARDGRALILPAVPGSGKSTLTAALCHSGWRLLSDEFGLLDLEAGVLHPLPRAIALKNRSIEVIRDFSPAVELGPTFRKTRKGDVAHARPPRDSLSRQHETARPGWILFPRYRHGSPLQLRAVTQSMAFTRLSQNAFNYRLLGARGFTALRDLVDGCRCWSADYGNLSDILAALDDLPTPQP